MIDNLYSKSIDEVKEFFSTDIEKGLDLSQVQSSNTKYGYNELNEKDSKSLLLLFLDQFKNFLIIVLIFAALISGLVGEVKDSILILTIIILNAIFGIVQENKAEKSMQALKKLTTPEAKVLRGGKKQKIPARELVPGDIVILDAGDYIPADGRIVESSSLRIEESALTGESLPVEKNNNTIDDNEVPLGDQINLVFMSSVVVYGRGKYIVTSTGMNTEIGKIAEMIQDTGKDQTPLQKRLAELGKVLSIVALVLCSLMFVIGIFQGREALPMFMTAVSLAVAAIPEGLPAIVTVVLALGVQKLVRKNAIVRKLPAVETLGSASVICSDKTGTLTQNKMTVKNIFINENKYDDLEELTNNEISAEMKRLLEVTLLCNDAHVDNENGETKEIGDPTETALITFANKFSLYKEEEEKRLNRVAEIPFDSERKLMSTVHKNGDKYLVFTKGAPDIIFNRCSKIMMNNKVVFITNEIIKSIEEANNSMSNKAYRVLGYAYKEIDELSDDLQSEEIENDLIFIGLTGMIDPPREEVKESINKCLSAGIKPIMITGDHKNTAIAIARELKIIDDSSEAISGIELDKISDDEFAKSIDNYSVYARVSPEHKVRIVSAWKKRGNVVAMTGDGVNDAPALKKADIGCAMGITGTDVSKEASDMILTDDNFATIVSAVEEGRGIYTNIRKCIHFLLSSNIGEILTLFLATLLNWAHPLLPIHILWVNLITDSLPAIALGVDTREKEIMNEKPRDPKASIFSGGLGFRIIYQGAIIGALTLIAFWLTLNNYGDIKTAQTVAFSVLGLSQISHSFNVRSENKSVFKKGIFTNKFLILANIFAATLQLLVLTVPFLQEIFNVVSLNLNQWMIVIGFSILPLIIVEILKLLLNITEQSKVRE
ncbi:MAG: calcium-translocating P-type ATPase, SERCA-type [Eubacteriaceae bacterium]